MYRSIRALTASLTILFSILVNARQSSHKDDVNISTPIGSAHAGKDVDASQIGLPVYPGARLRQNDKDANSANLGIFTEAFGFKLVLAHYDSDDTPAKLVAYYREKLRKYGKVLECHTQEHGGDINVNESGHDSAESASESKELKCEGDNSGPVIELKAGTDNDQHIVAVEPAEKGAGSTFALVYVHTRGKQGDI